MISVIDMPSPAESVWWRGKKSHLQKSQYEVGFFPQSCVATIGKFKIHLFYNFNSYLHIQFLFILI